MTPEMFHKFDPFIFIFLPEFNMSVTTGCDDEICPKTKTEYSKNNKSTSRLIQALI